MSNLSGYCSKIVVFIHYISRSWPMRSRVLPLEKCSSHVVQCTRDDLPKYFDVCLLCCGAPYIKEQIPIWLQWLLKEIVKWNLNHKVSNCKKTLLKKINRKDLILFQRYSVLLAKLLRTLHLFGFYKDAIILDNIFILKRT